MAIVSAPAKSAAERRRVAAERRRLARGRVAAARLAQRRAAPPQDGPAMARRAAPRLAPGPDIRASVRRTAPPAGAAAATGAAAVAHPPLVALRREADHRDGRIATGVAGVQRRTMRPPQVALVVGVAALLAALLNAVPMQRAAETSPFGVRRSAALAVLDPLAAAARFTRLDQPRAALDTALGHRDPGGGDGSGPGGAPLTAGALTPVAAPTRAATMPPRRRIHGALIRRPTAAAPLRLWVGGDSVAGYFGFGMDDIAEQSGVVAAHSHYQTSTGLSRPDYFDWPAHLQEDMRTYDPEVVVFLVGANDDQPLEVNGQVQDFGSDGWRAEYAHRVGAVMDRLLAEGRRVVWVGLPAMRNPDFDARMQVMNTIYGGEAARRPGVVFFDSRPVMSNGSGQYCAYLPDGDGRQTLMRAEDGIHLTPIGGRRLAQAVLTVVLDQIAAAGGGD